MASVAIGRFHSRCVSRPSVRARRLSELLDSIRACRNESYALWGHSIRVAQTARDLARAVGLSLEARRMAYLGGLLHDVGKTASCAHALFKPGPLTAAERKRLNRHPLLGAAMVSDLEIPCVTDVVAMHHELFDGSGYPQGLKAEEIPLLARIVTVADTYEAVRESRPYRPVGCTRDEALRLVRTLGAERKLDSTVSVHLAAVVALGASPSKEFYRARQYFEKNL